MSIIFVFLDGVGLAFAGADNPLTCAATPSLHTLLGGPLTIEHIQKRDGLLLKAIDASLGVPGLPQSGTGQTALLTGVNAAALHGRHQPHFPPVALRPLLFHHSILRTVVTNNRRALFANVFIPHYWEALANRRVRRSASVIAAEGAGLRFCDLDDLRAGRAVCWDITGAILHRYGFHDMPLVPPDRAGAQLAWLASEYDFVFYESFLPDLAGHGRLSMDVPTAMALIDGFLGGIVAALRPEDTLVISSDHGNVESIAAPTHTTNPVPLLVVGPAVTAFVAVDDIAGVAGGILNALALPFPSYIDR